MFCVGHFARTTPMVLRLLPSYRPIVSRALVARRLASTSASASTASQVSPTMTLPPPLCGWLCSRPLLPVWVSAWY